MAWFATATIAAVASKFARAVGSSSAAAGRQAFTIAIKAMSWIGAG